MSESVERLATYENPLRVSEYLATEIIDGRLVIHPRPAPRHPTASSSLRGELDGPFHKGREVHFRN